MLPIPVPSLRLILCILSPIFFLGCATPSTVNNEAEIQRSVRIGGSSRVFRLQDDTRIPGYPAPCGEAIASSEVVRLETDHERPGAIVAERFPNAQLVHSDYLQIALIGTVEKTKRHLDDFFADLGCDLIVYGGQGTILIYRQNGLYPSSITYESLLLVWGTK